MGSKHPSLTTNQGENMPRKGYKRQAGRSVGMPERMEAQNTLIGAFRPVRP